MDQETKEISPKAKTSWTNKKWLGIVGILVVIIAVGIGYIVASPPGRIGVTIESFIPEGEVIQTTNVTIEFSRNLVDEKSVDVKLEKVPVTFTPPIPGEFRWISKNKLRFFPEAVLMPSTQYIVEVLPEICSDPNTYLKGNRKFRFYTQRMRVENAYFSYILKNLETKELAIFGNVEFNYPVNLEELKKHLILTYENGVKIPYQIITNESSSSIQLETGPVSREERQKIKLFINNNLIPINGSLGMEEDFVKVFDMKRKDELKVEGVFPQQQGNFGSLKIRFSSPVAADLAKVHISVEPAIDYQIVSNYNYIELRGNFLAGTGYTIDVKKDLMGIDGSILKRDFSTRAVIENLEPSINFVGDGIYLSRKGKLNVGLSTINVDKVELQIEKVYANNLTYLANSTSLQEKYSWYDLDSLGKVIHTEEISIPHSLNEEVITPINMREYLKDESLGIFSLIARDTEERWRYGRKWVMITDLGITVKMAGDQFLVWLNSLSSLEPIPGAEINLISMNNQNMKTASTDKDGVASFQLTKKTLEEFSPFIVTASKDNDLSFLEINRRQIETTDFDVEGQPYLRNGYDAYIYGDRDIYRPGEKARLVAAVRGPNTIVPPPFPLRIEVLGPDNQVFQDFTKRTNDEGLVDLEFDLPAYIKTGRYIARALVGKGEIGRGIFNVEEFMPDRMKVKVQTDSDSYATGKIVNISIEAITLFGPPASNRVTEFQYVIESKNFSPQQWRSFTFNNPARQFSEIRSDVNRFNLDQDGKYKLTLPLPAGIQPPSSLLGVISATVLEPGGRGVTSYKTIDIHPYTHYVGLRQTKEDYAEVNKPKEFEFVVVDQNGQPASGRQCDVSCFRITWNSILRKVDGSYRYVSEKQENLENSFMVTSNAGASKFTFTPKDYGEYRVEIKDSQALSSSSVTFYASGWGYAPWAMDKPEKLKIDLDKTLYRPGSTAKVQIRSPFPGRLLLTVESDEIHYRKSLIMKENTGNLEIPVLPNYKPNVYITASVIRSTNSLERYAPVRAFGTVPLPVDCSENKIDVALDAPAEMRPKNKLTVSYTVKPNKGSLPAFLTIAAVDEGICQLTNFKTPDPFGYFFGKKRLEVNSYDIYSAILPEIEKATTPSTASGDEARRKRIAPMSIIRVKPVALWSGLIKSDRKGKGSITFDIPEFNGTLRLMAVSFSGSSFGSSSKEVRVFDPIVLTPTYPRFIASGDSFQVPISVFNGTGRSGQFTVRLESQGPLEDPQPGTQTISLADKSEGLVVFSIKAKQNIGKATFNLSATGNGETSSVTTEVPIRSASPPITLTGSGVVKAGSTAQFTLPGDWISGTEEFDLTLSAFPVLQFASSLQYLLRYPYGCAEQTTSRVFPLLYFNDLAKVVEPELFGTKSADYFIREGINRLESMQMPSGDFSFWPGEANVNPWTSIYVSHFFVEAKKAGYEIPDRIYNSMIKAMQNHARAASNEKWRLETKVYACYVLAAAGFPERSTMLYLKNTELKWMSDYSQYQLAGAFALSGDIGTARSLIPSTVTPQEMKRETGGNFNSPIRAQAIMLDILAEVNPDHPSVPKLIKTLADSASRYNRWYTTQENAYAFLALGKIMRKQPPGNYTGTAKLNGSQLGNFTSKDRRFKGQDWGGKTITLSIQGTGTCYYYWKAFGIAPGQSAKEFDQELIVRRRYLNRNGQPVSQFRQGDLIVAEISARATTESLDNVVISDLLPAGFEIENPRLESRAGIPWIKDNGQRPDYMDIRDDRMLIFTSLSRQYETKFYYAIRVVNMGDFALPAIAGEAMYDPEKASVAGSGRIRVMDSQF